MSKKQINHIIRAWKDQDYRSSLSAKQRASLPQHPAGSIELDNAALKEVIGGYPHSQVAQACTYSSTWD